MRIGGFFLLIVAPLLLGCLIIGVKEEISYKLKEKKERRKHK